MSKSIFFAPHFNDEAAAYAYVEAHVWPNGRVCPHCGVVDRSGALKGKDDRIGLYKCYACRKKFSVKVGTIFESSHIAMRDWLVAIHMICSSKKGVSANQLHRTLGITLKSAWFMGHRIREAMTDGSLGQLGGQNQVVEADESYVGGKAKNRAFRDPAPKKAVVTLVERDGRARSFHVANVTGKTVGEVLAKHADKKSALMTDDSPIYPKIGAEFANHHSVNHSADEYVRLGGYVHSNTAENYFSILKRGITGVYHSVSEAHLHRYLAEFDFRYSNRSKLGVEDAERATRALKGVVGKRLTYETSRSPAQ